MGTATSRRGNDRVMLVTTVKDEGPNILEWIGYHRMIGFTDIVVFQNDSFDTTAQTLRKLAGLGVIRYFDNGFRKPGIKADFQNRAYRRAARLPEYAAADWCMALDGDEFLRVNCGQGRVQDLIGAVDDRADAIRLNWRVFGSSHLRELDGRLVTERFTLANVAELPVRQPMPVKTLFRTGAFERPGIHLPRAGAGAEPVSVNGSGRPIEDVTVRGFQVTDPEPYALAQVNHYMVKDSDSFLMKSARGSSSHPDRQIALEYWRRRNVNHQECGSLAGLRDAILDEVRALDARAGGALTRLRNRALRAWRHRIAEIKDSDEGRALYEALV